MLILPRSGEFLGCGVAQGRMGPAVIVVAPASFDDLAGIVEIEKPVLVETFIPELPVERFDEGVLDRLTGLDEVEPNAVAPGPFVERLADHLGTVVEDDLQGQPAGLRQPLEDPHNADTGQRRIHLDRRAFAREVVDDVEAADGRGATSMAISRSSRPWRAVGGISVPNTRSGN